MSEPKANEYERGELVRCTVVATDDETTTALTTALPAGQSVLPVHSALLGVGFSALSYALVGEGRKAEIVRVAAQGPSATAIPITTPTVQPHQPGTPVALIRDAETVPTFTITSPDGTVTPGTGVERSGPGKYHCDVRGSERGTWSYRAELFGQFGAENFFIVR